MSKKKQQKQQRCYRHKKPRGVGRKLYRSVIVSNITEEGFDLAFKGMQYHINRDTFAWFLGSTDEELKQVRLVPGGHPDDHGEYSVEWELLDVKLGTRALDNPQDTYEWANAYRERYYMTRTKK